MGMRMACELLSRSWMLDQMMRTSSSAAQVATSVTDQIIVLLSDCAVTTIGSLSVHSGCIYTAQKRRRFLRILWTLVLCNFFSSVKGTWEGWRIMNVRCVFGNFGCFASSKCNASIVTARIRSMGEGTVFTGIYLSTPEGGGTLAEVGTPSQGRYPPAKIGNPPPPHPAKVVTPPAKVGTPQAKVGPPRPR